MQATILDLCGGTGGWSAPYREAGYRVVIVDPLADSHPDNLVMTVQEFRDRWQLFGLYADVFVNLRGVLAAPPCTEFAGSGARWWAKKAEVNPGYLAEAVEIVSACLDIIEDACHFCGPRRPWYALENPVGRLRKAVGELDGREVGEPRLIFNPCDYGGWLDPAGDSYTKKTCIWGQFNIPEKRPVPISHEKGSSPIHRAPPSADRWRFRSVTPRGFANAFFAANP